MTSLRGMTELFGRVLLMVLFVYSGIEKITGYAATTGYMATAGVPAAFLPLAIVVEIAGTIVIVLGWQTRVASVLLAGYTLVAAMLFHNNFADQVQLIMFLKNVSICGAFLLLAANGAGPLSLDARRAR